MMQDELESRQVNGGGFGLYGKKQTHPHLKAYNGTTVYIKSTGKTALVYEDPEGTKLICTVMLNY